MGRDQTILRAAEQLFYERSFAGVGVDEIGARAGITGPGIYRHFSGKDEILATLLDEATDALLRRVGEPLDDPWEDLTHLVRAQAEFAIEHAKLAAIWVREVRALAPEYRRRWQRRESQYIKRLEGVLGRCFPERSKDELTSAAWALIYQINCVGLWPSKARRAENIAELVADLALGGLAALGEPARASATG